MTTLAPMRQAYGEALVELGATRADVVVLSADVSNSDFSWMFAEHIPPFLNVGIAEQALVDVAAGLAYAGWFPWRTPSPSCSRRGRSRRSARTVLRRSERQVVGAYAGVSVSIDGPPTHHAITVIAIMRARSPTWRWFAGDPAAVGRLLPQVAAWPGPVYMRLNRNEVPDLFDADMRQSSAARWSIARVAM